MLTLNILRMLNSSNANQIIQIQLTQIPIGYNYKYASVALIKGPTEVYVREGSPVTFTCEIIPTATYGGQEAFLSAKSRIKWCHNGNEITLQVNVYIIYVYEKSILIYAVCYS